MCSLITTHLEVCVNSRTFSLRSGERGAIVEVNNGFSSLLEIGWLFDVADLFGAWQSLACVIEDGTRDYALVALPGYVQDQERSKSNVLSHFHRLDRLRPPSLSCIPSNSMHIHGRIKQGPWHPISQQGVADELLCHSWIYSLHAISVHLSFERPVSLQLGQMNSPGIPMNTISSLALGIFRKYLFLDEFISLNSDTILFTDSVWKAEDFVVIAETMQTLEQVNQSNLEKLTQLERSILELMALGLTNREIAAELYQSDSTVRNLSSRIYNKIGARNRQEAIAIFISGLQSESVGALKTGV